MKELDEIIGELIWMSEQCIDDGNNWVRFTHFSEVADKLIAINTSLSTAPGNAQQQVQAENAIIPPPESEWPEWADCIFVSFVGANGKNQIALPQINRTNPQPITMTKAEALAKLAEVMGKPVVIEE